MWRTFCWSSNRRSGRMEEELNCWTRFESSRKARGVLDSKAQKFSSEWLTSLTAMLPFSSAAQQASQWHRRQDPEERASKAGQNYSSLNQLWGSHRPNLCLWLQHRMTLNISASVPSQLNNLFIHLLKVVLRKPSENMRCRNWKVLGM